jgi:hypothetical protein
LVNNPYCNKECLSALSIHEELKEELTFIVNCFEFLRSNVFALREFEDVLGSIDNSHTTCRKDLPDISCPEPPILP